MLSLSFLCYNACYRHIVLFSFIQASLNTFVGKKKKHIATTFIVWSGYSSGCDQQGEIGP